jgi:hypothetical protein
MGHHGDAAQHTVSDDDWACDGASVNHTASVDEKKLP